MKKISVVVPCWCEEKSVMALYNRIKNVFESQLVNYQYEIIFVDDHSPDNTWTEITQVCSLDPKVKGIRNAKNFGYTRNVFRSLLYGSGDATFMLFGDLQDPPELLPEFVKKWESGYKVILGQKTSSNDSKFLYWMSSIYYKIVGEFSSIQQIPHFTGYGLYDKIFIEVLAEIDDPQPYLKGIVAEFAMDQNVIQYTQQESNRGSSGFNFMKRYDAAMIGITSYTKALMRMATFVGAGLGCFSLLLSLFVLINKLLYWDTYPVGTAAILIGIFGLGAVQLFFIGILGEYILSINTRVMKRPLVVIGEKINFEDRGKDGL